MNAAHLHLATNHLPVVGSLFALLLLIWAMFRRSDELKRTALGAVIVVTLATFPAYFSGEAAMENSPTKDGFEGRLVESHEGAAEKAFTVMFVAGVVSAAGLWRTRKGTVPGSLCSLVLVITLASCAMMGWAANLGGQLRHPEIRQTR